MDLELKGKRALVTGSSTGIGSGIAKRLAAEGAQVVVHGRNAERARQMAEEIMAAGGQAKVALGALDEDGEAAHVAEEALNAFGGIDILVNNAGGGTPDAPIAWLDVPADIWARNYNSNVISAARMINALAPAMKERGWGRIVNLSSYAAQASSGGIPHYAASKNAIVSMSFSLSKALAFTGVTVNTISPGLIMTNAAGPWLDKVAKSNNIPRDEAEEWVTSNMLRQTVKRMGQTHDVAYAAAFLCSPHADFITGANIRVDGGASPASN